MEKYHRLSRADGRANSGRSSHTLNGRHTPCTEVDGRGNGDTNIVEIADAIPRHSKTNKVLSLCFVDPNDIGIKFNTLRTLGATRMVDFVVLLALYMDALRAEQQFAINPTKINQFLDITKLDRHRAYISTPKKVSRSSVSKGKGRRKCRSAYRRSRKPPNTLPRIYIPLLLLSEFSMVLH